MKNIYRFVFFLIFLFYSNYQCQENTYAVDEIIVSAGRTPISFSNLTRSVSVITLGDVKLTPVNNIQDLLKYVGSVDLRARGTEGVQADISIRGGSFEQTLLLIDGVKVSDPQTGHHNLNIPISPQNIERIEILKGQGARIFGANAFSGAVNIITKKSYPASANLSILGGDHGLYDLNVAASFPFRSLSNYFSIERKRSDGYAHNTQYDLTNFSLGQTFALGENHIKTFLGYVDKDFGANSFYSDRFPNQSDRIITRFANVSSELRIEDLTFSPKIYWRNNYDDYHLDYSRADWNHNIHRTQSYGAEIQASLTTGYGTTTFGGELCKDEIASSNLGIHNRSSAALFAEQIFQPAEDINLSIGFFANNYSLLGWKFWPGIDLGFRVNDNLKLFSSIGQAFRIPSFTELYYVSPANMGNPDLVYEQTINYEFGFVNDLQLWRLEGNLFLKKGKDLIDWVRPQKEEPWRVENVAETNTLGAEIVLDLSVQSFASSAPVKNIKISFTYLSSDRKTGGLESKYLLDHLKHQLLVSFSNELPFGFTQSWFTRFEQRENSESHFIVDSQISKSAGNLKFFIRATNLFNKSYFDIIRVQLPGRWISAGMNYSLGEE